MTQDHDDDVIEPMDNNTMVEKYNDDMENDEDYENLSIEEAKTFFDAKDYEAAMEICQRIYKSDARRKDNMLLMGAIHYERNEFAECIFYNQQALRVNRFLPQAYCNIGNALRELGDVKAATSCYMTAIKIEPRFSGAYANLASTYFQVKETNGALETYQMAVALDPNFFEVHNNIGILLKSQGKFADAKSCFQESIRIKPDFAIAWSNLAGLLKDTGDVETSVAYYEEAKKLSPRCADVYSNLGVALRMLGRLNEALSALETAVELRPHFALAYCNMGNVFYDKNQMEQAIVTYKKALSIDPKYADVHCNLGNAYFMNGQTSKGCKHLLKCLRLSPEHPHAYNNIGNLLRECGLVNEAKQCYINACRLMPQFAIAHNNLACLLDAQGARDSAIVHLEHGVKANPRFGIGLNNLSRLYKDSGRTKESMATVVRAIQANPTYAPAYHNLACLYAEAGRVDDAITCFQRALSIDPKLVNATAGIMFTLSAICDWRGRDKHVAKIRDYLDALKTKTPNVESAIDGIASLPVHPLDLVTMSSQELGQDCARLQALQDAIIQHITMNAPLTAKPRLRFRARMPDERLRIGYVSTQFGASRIGTVLQRICRNHDKNEIETFCYSIGNEKTNVLAQTISEVANHFRYLHDVSDYEAARKINRDRVHILVNLDGYLKGNRNGIFAYQPAPMQVFLPLVYPSGMSAEFIQYNIVDNELGKGDDAKGIGKMIVLDRSLMLSDNDMAAIPDSDQCCIDTREAHGLEEGQFVFACFNRGHCINADVLDVWVRILKKVEKSVMWIHCESKLMEANLRAEFRERGIADNRYLFAEPCGNREYLSRCTHVDLYLDTPVCNDVVCTLDVLFAGTPIITTASEKGGKMASRLTSSVLHQINLPQLVTKSMDEYEKLAVNLATNKEKMDLIKHQVQLSRNSSSLFDHGSWVTSWEAALKAAWRKYEQGESLSDIRL